LLAGTLLMMVLGLLPTGCAGELPVPGRIATGPTDGITNTTEPRWIQIGDQVAETWAQAIQALVPLLEGSPPASTLESRVSELKEQFVQKMVALGREIEDLDQFETQEVYRRATEGLNACGDSEWFQSYVRLYQTYADGPDQDFAVLLSTFNTLTKYAFFEQLKAEDPEEARRLGIE
jgi:hypothetical protein